MNVEQTGSICPTCGGPVTQREVEKLLRGGVHTTIVRVSAEVCERCGERLYARDVVKRFEEIRDKLARQDTGGFVPLGQSFEVVSSPTSVN